MDDGRPRGFAADRDTIPRAVLAGTLGGLATLAKVSGVFVLPALLLARRLERGRLAASDGWLAAAHLGLAAPWWVYRAIVLGNPFAFDTVTQPGAAASFWAERTMSRTPLYYLASLARSPLVLVGLVVALALAARGLAAWRRGERARPGLAHALFGPLVVAAACVFPGKEARHVLHAYPSLLLLGGGVIAGLASRLDGRGRAALGLSLALVLGLEARHGLALAFDVARMP